jgi:hypothetical protein
MFTQYNMSLSPLLQGSEKIDKIVLGKNGQSGLQNRTVQLVEPDSLVFPNRTELSTKEIDIQALIDISPPLSLSTKKCWGGLLEASLIVLIFVFSFFNILRICQRRGVNRRRVR